MVFSVMYIVCKGPKVDAWRTQSVTYVDRQNEVIC